MRKRKQISPGAESLVCRQSRRRCCLCFAYDFDFGEKLGQIAHLDGDPSNNADDNLAFLCLEHHARYDSRTSQSKNYGIAEVKAARKDLYDYVQQIVDWRARLSGSLREALLSNSATIIQQALAAELEDDDLKLKGIGEGSIEITATSAQPAFQKLVGLFFSGTALLGREILSVGLTDEWLAVLFAQAADRNQMVEVLTSNRRAYVGVPMVAASSRPLESVGLVPVLRGTLDENSRPVWLAHQLREKPKPLILSASDIVSARLTMHARRPNHNP